MTGPERRYMLDSWVLITAARWRLDELLSTVLEKEIQALEASLGSVAQRLVDLQARVQDVASSGTAVQILKLISPDVDDAG